MDSFCLQLTELRGSLLRAARGRLRNSDWAEDAVSETMLAALELRPDFSEPGRLRAWLYGVLRHKVMDQLRRHLDDRLVVARGEMLDTEAGAGDSSTLDDPSKRAGDSQFIAALANQLDGLPPLQARAFVMRECWGGSTTEVCSALGISAANLWTMLHRARHRLRTGLALHR